MQTNDAFLGKCGAYLIAAAQGPVTEEEGKRRCAITISRETGAGAVTIARLVAEKMQQRQRENRPWAAFDRNLVKQVLGEHHLPERLKEYMPEDTRPVLKEALEEILGLHPSSITLVEKTSETIRRLARRGGVVLVGRGGHLITADLAHVLHVRLVAPLDFRLNHVREFYQLGKAEARDYVTRNDNARKRYVKRHFLSDVSDPLGYHLTINTGAMSFEYAADLIAEAASAHHLAVPKK